MYRMASRLTGSSLPSNEEIEVAGPAESIDKYKEIPLGQIDIKSLELGKTRNL